LHKQLQCIAGLKAVNSHTEQFQFLDSFDWRLYRKGLALQASSHEEGWRLNLIEIPTGKLLAIAPTSSLPRFISDFPAGTLSKKLTKPLFPRALLSICELRLKRHEYVYQNDEGKQYLRLFLDQPQACLGNESKTKKLSNWLAVEPVRGYEKEAQKLIRLLVKQLGLKQKETCLLLPCLNELEVEPTFINSKAQVELSNNETVPPALKRIFLSFLDTLCANEDGLIKQIDTEFLHDYRIAVRRTRSLLEQMKKIIPPDKLQAFNDEFAWLSALTGPARDYDVMLLEFADYQAMLSDYQSSDFCALREFLQQQQQLVYSRLSEALQSNRYTELKQNWTDYLESNEFATGKGSEQKISKYATKRLARVYKTVLAEGSTIGPSSSVELFHKLRKSCKKLRYLLEMFGGIYPSGKVKVLIKELKKLQDDLGELQDLEVHAEILQTFLAQETSNQENNPAPANPIQQLIDRMHARKQILMENFHEKFSFFASKRDKKLFMDMLGLKKI
jgi:CHAD domain-containing protein